MRVFLLDKSYQGEKLYPLRAREKQYLEKVLRLDEGTVFTAKDKNDCYYNATILKDGIISLEPTEDHKENLLDNLSGYEGTFAPIDVYVSILKGKKNENVARALTEIGVRKIVFVDSEFSQEHTFSAHQIERIETIMKEAVQQCGGHLPSLIGPISFKEAIMVSEGKKAILHQGIRVKSTSLDILFSSPDIKNVASLFIGPEGGFSEEECKEAEEQGIVPVLLRTNILRAETASVYATSAVQTLLHRNS